MFIDDCDVVVVVDGGWSWLLSDLGLMLKARDISAVFERSKHVFFEVPPATYLAYTTLFIPYSYVVQTDGDKKLNVVWIRTDGDKQQITKN